MVTKEMRFDKLVAMVVVTIIIMMIFMLVIETVCKVNLIDVQYRDYQKL